MDTKQVQAMVSLLSDTDADIYQHIKTQIQPHFLIAIPFLEEAAKQNGDKLLQKRAAKLLQKFYVKRTLKELNEWKEGTDRNLIEASIILSRFLSPTLDVEHLVLQLEQLKKDTWLEMSDEFTDLEKIHILNHVFFKIYKFNSEQHHWYLPQNNELNHLLDKRSGNAVILSILYLEVAQSMKLPVFAVNLPDNFILSYLNPKELTASGEALFYINPINGGSIFNKTEIDEFLKKNKLPLDRYYYEPCDHLTIIKRLILDFIVSYESSGDETKTKYFKRFLNAI